MAYAPENFITAEMSASMIHEFITYCLHTILYQRGIYPSEGYALELYKSVPMTVLLGTTKSFIDRSLSAAKDCLTKRLLSRVTLCFVSQHGNNERWEFVVNYPQLENDETPTFNKPLHLIQKEIRAVMGEILWTVLNMSFNVNACSIQLDLTGTPSVLYELPQLGFAHERVHIVNENDSETIAMGQVSTGLATVAVYMGLTTEHVQAYQ